MKLISTLVILLCSTVLAKPDVIYLEPVPNAKYVSIYNNLIIGLNIPVSESTLTGLIVNVTGSKSGIHTGDIKLTTDKKRILFKPHQPFIPDETVTVNIISNSNQIKYNSSDNFSYSFNTEVSHKTWDSEKVLRSELGEYYRAPFKLDIPAPPQLTVTISNNPSPGRIFVSSYNEDPSYLIIAENSGNLYWSRGYGNQTLDFKKQPNGTLTFFRGGANKFFQMNSSYQIIDSFACGNEYNTDFHELVLLPNKHALLMAYDPQIVDMSQIVPGGDTSATVIGLIIQELGENKDVVFQWRSWDHFQITDATNTDLTASSIDYVHGNAIDLDTDGNLLISSRNMDEITKIDRSKGTIIWRLGGTNNQFTFIDNSLRFSRQHCIRKISNGNITLYDNGNFHNPPFSRAVEYTLDEVNKTATQVWEYRNNPSIYGFAMGSVQRLPNGNTLIGWGFTSPTLSEVTPEGEVALEMKLPSTIVSYRAFKFDWDSTVTSVTVNSSIPVSYSLSQNYPNPFNPSTSISFSLPSSQDVILKVYDVMGREVSSLVNEYKQAGSYNILFNASGLASGVYIYKLEAGNYSASKKMVLIK